MTRASGASSEVYVKKTIAGNDPSRTFHTHRGFQLENSNGERSGNRFRPHATLEAFRSCDGLHKRQLLNYLQLTQLSWANS